MGKRSEECEEALKKVNAHLARLKTSKGNRKDGYTLKRERIAKKDVINIRYYRD